MKLQVMEAIIETYGDIIKGLRNEINIASDGITDLNDVIKDLKAEIKELKADIRHDTKVCEDYDDDLIKEIDELKADKGALYDHNTHLQADIKEKEKQYHLLASSKSSHYPKEYKAEAEEYFHHNPKAEEIAFYMLDDNDGCIDYETLEQYEIARIINTSKECNI